MLLQSAARVWPSAAVHDTVQAVLRDPAYRRSLRGSVADRIMIWLVDAIRQLSRMVQHAPSARTVTLTILALLVLFVVARLILSARARDARAKAFARARTPGASTDPWRVAERLASENRYEEAAHALYHAVLAALTQAERVRLHPSKTSGDYARELRRRGAVSFTPFRAFARRFDEAVYGHGRCDASAFAELRALSAPFHSRAKAA